MNDDPLTHRPLLEQERVMRRVEERAFAVDLLHDLMTDTPSLKIDTEPYRSPKVKRRPPKASVVTVRRAA